MLRKKGTPHCCDAPLFGQGSQTNGKQLPLKLLVLPRHRQPGVTAKSTQGSATLRLGLCRIPIPYGSVTAATLGRSVRRDWHSIGARAAPKFRGSRDFQALTPRAESQCDAPLVPQAQPLQDQQGDFVRGKRMKPDETSGAFRPVRDHRLGRGRCTRCSGIGT